MSQFNDCITDDGMLPLNDQDSASHLQQKYTMLYTELQRFNDSGQDAKTLISNNIISTILYEIIDNPDQQESHNQTCHKNTFAKAGPAGWTNSYSKKC